MTQFIEIHIPPVLGEIPMPTNDYRPNGLNIFCINWRKLRNGQSLPLKVYLDAPKAGYGLNISNDHWRGAETAEALDGP